MPTGRPNPNFKDAKQLQGCIDGYFEMCDAHVVRAWVGRGQNAVEVDQPDPLPYTFTRLAVICGCSVAKLTDIQRKGEADPAGPEGEMAEVLAFARQRIEANLEERMLHGDGWGPGHIFALKNHYGWRDTVEHTGADGGPIVVRFDLQDAQL